MYGYLASAALFNISANIYEVPALTSCSFRQVPRGQTRGWDTFDKQVFIRDGKPAAVVCCDKLITLRINKVLEELTTPGETMTAKDGKRLDRSPT